MRAKKTRGKSWRKTRRYAPFITLTLSIMLLQSIMSAPDSTQSANEAPTSQTWQVEAGSDDCHVYGNNIALNTTYVILTHVSSIAESGFRWTNITIPRGATIESAYLEVQASGNYSSPTADLVIRGEDTHNASTFSTASDFIGRSRTNASVTWDLPTFVVGTWYTSPDITTIIQEIVGRQNWTSGNALALLCIATETGEYRTVYAHDYSSVYSAQLSVTWSPPSPPPPPTIGFSPKDIVKQAEIGQNFTVNVTVTNANDLYAWQAGLTFNPGLLECVDIAEGEFLKGKAVRTLWTPGTIDNSSGIIHYHACTLTGNVIGINGNGTLWEITFKIKNYGNSTLQLTDIILLDSTLTDTDNIPVDGSIFVTAVGDVDGDGDVDGFDLTYMCGCYGATPGHPRWDEDCDINGDGIIDGYDLTPACGNYGWTLPPLAPDFTATDIDGNNVTLSDFRGNVVVLDLMRKECRGSWQKVDEVLIPFWSEYKNNSEVVMITLCWQANASELRALGEAHPGMDWILISDPDAFPIAATHNIRTTPTIILVNKAGYMRYKYESGYNPDLTLAQLKEWVDELLLQ